MNMNDFKWSSDDLLRLKVGARVTWVSSEGEREEHYVLQEPVYDPYWSGGWRVFVASEDTCLTTSVESLDPSSVVPAEVESERDLIRLAHSLKAECAVLRGQVQHARRELLEEMVRDLESVQSPLAEKYESLLEDEDQ
jgi:hypothetical protein